MKNTQLGLFFSLIICISLFACEENPIPPTDPEPIPDPIVLEGYYIGSSEYREYTYVTSYLDVERMEIRDTFYVKVDTSFSCELDTMVVRKVSGDSLYSVDWKYGRNLPYLELGPDTAYPDSMLLNGWWQIWEYDYKINYGIGGFGTDSLRLNYFYKYLFQVEVMPEYELSFQGVRREPLD